MPWTRTQRYLLTVIIALAAFCIAIGVQRAAYGRIALATAIAATASAD